MSKKTKGVITAGHPETADAACQILAQGGNAFDAAIAAFYASFITEACMSSAGGGAFALSHQSNGRSLLFDFFVQTPKKKRPISEIDFFPFTLDFGETKEDFHIGMGSAAVPGSIAGIYAMHEHLCTLPMHILLEPAIKLAKEGAIVDDFQFFDFTVLRPMLSLQEDPQSVFFKNGELLPVGDKIKMPYLADFLDVLTKEGPRLFYEGEIAKQVADDCANLGGFLQREDFANYSVNIKDPLRFNYRGHQILTNPLPSSGGALIALGLDKIQPISSPYSIQDPKHLIQVFKALKRIDEVDKTPANLAKLIHQILPQIGQDFPAGENKKWGSTTHLNVMDEHHNAISITTSNGEGCGYMIPNTHIMMNNMLGEAALLPNGFHNWDCDVRLSSMMTPTLILDAKDQIAYALGTGGASRIPRAIMQVIHYLIDHQLTVEEAVKAPRAHVEHKAFFMEPGFFNDPEILNTDHTLKVWDDFAMFFGGVHTIKKTKQGFDAVGDFRRSGVVRTVN